MKCVNRNLRFSFGVGLIIFETLSSNNVWAGDAPAELEPNAASGETPIHLRLLPGELDLGELKESIFSYLNFSQLVEMYSSNEINYRDKLEIGRVLLKAVLGASLGELIEIHSSNRINDVAINAEIRQIILEKALGEFILLPEVTQQDIDELRQAGVDTSITTPMPAFRVAKNKTPVALYYAVYGRFPAPPDLHPLYNRRFSDQEKTEIIAKWKANPELPLTFTTIAEDIALAGRLREMTGRRFSVTTNAQNEYSIRGRTLVDGEPTGSITSTTYYFGNDATQALKHGWFYKNSSRSAHGVNENPPEYSHPFGINQAIGNVWVRSSDGVGRGGYFDYGWEDGMSSISVQDTPLLPPSDVVGFRLAEEARQGTNDPAR